MKAAKVPEVDVAVVGAGLAGLSFVGWLEQLSADAGVRPPSVRLIDPRPRYTHDRSWCFWEADAHPFSEAITHRWSRWQVAHAGATASVNAAERPYVLLPADKLYKRATDCIARNSEFELSLGERVEAIEPRNEDLLLRTDQGWIRARSVIDTRPPAISEATARCGLWQVFRGLEITLDYDHFDPSTAMLMDFEDDREEVRFLYVLPTSERRALVELTAFRRAPHGEDLAARLDARIAERFGGRAKCVREEHGKLPMMPLPAAAPGDPRIISAGTAGGWVRPSSGYLFSSCQRGAKDLAQQALTASSRGAWRWRPPRVRPADLDLLDHIFLRAMRNAPAEAPAWFLRLFARTPADRHARFLSDDPSLADRLAVIAALPPRPMLHAAVQCLRGPGDSP